MIKKSIAVLLCVSLIVLALPSGFALPPAQGAEGSEKAGVGSEPFRVGRLGNLIQAFLRPEFTGVAPLSKEELQGIASDLPGLVSATLAGLPEAADSTSLPLSLTGPVGERRIIAVPESHAAVKDSGSPIGVYTGQAGPHGQQNRPGIAHIESGLDLAAHQIVAVEVRRGDPVEVDGLLRQLLDQAGERSSSFGPDVTVVHGPGRLRRAIGLDRALGFWCSPREKSISVDTAMPELEQKQEQEQEKLAQKAIKRSVIVIALSCFIQNVSSFADPNSVGSFFAYYLAYDHLHLDLQGITTFTNALLWVWVASPIWGFISDLFPLRLPFLGRTHRKNWMLISNLVAAAALAYVGLRPFSYHETLLALLTGSWGLSFGEAMKSAFVAERGKHLGRIESFQSLQMGALYAADLLLVIAGYAMDLYGLHTMFFALAGTQLLHFFVTAFWLKEDRAHFTSLETFLAAWAWILRRLDASHSGFAALLKTFPASWSWIRHHPVMPHPGFAALRETLRGIRSVFTSGSFWAALGFIAVWMFNPVYGNPVQYYMTKVLNFSPVDISQTTTINSIGTIVGSILYFKFFSKIPMKRLLNINAAMYVVATLAYLGLLEYWSAMALNFINGVVSIIGTLAIYNLMARFSPDEGEGSVFSVLLSIINLACLAGYSAGGYLYDLTGYTLLVLISAATTAICWAFVPFIRLPDNIRK